MTIRFWTEGSNSRLNDRHSIVRYGDTCRLSGVYILFVLIFTTKTMPITSILFISAIYPTDYRQKSLKYSLHLWTKIKYIKNIYQNFFLRLTVIYDTCILEIQYLFLWVSECLLVAAMLNVTCNDISVIYVTAQRRAGGLKKLDLRSGSQRHRHFVGFFNVPVQAPTRANLFTVILRNRPISVAFYDAQNYSNANETVTW